MSLFRRKTQSEQDAAFEQALSEQYDRRQDDLTAAADDDWDDDNFGDAEVFGDDQNPDARDGRATQQSDRPTIAFGAITVPAYDGMQVRAEMDEQENVVAISVLMDDTMLQMQAFAAPKSESLWDDVRQEIAEGIRGSQGKAREADGPLGREIRAEVVLTGPDGATSRQPARFVGMDGSRWFLRGVITGAGATEPERAKVIEQVFAEVQVERGDFAAAPRDLLPLTLPEQQPFLSEQPPASQ